MHIGIIGAGAAGLTAARSLVQSGHAVTVYEKSDKGIGGIAGAVPIHNTWIDKFYHHIFTSDREVLSLIDEMGLSGDMLWEEPKNGLMLDGRLYPFTSPLNLLLFPPISFASRIRMGLAVLSAKSVKDYKSMEDISAREWLVKKAGQDSYDKIWRTLLYSKFGKDADQVSGVWIWNKFKLRGSTRSNLNSELLGYLRGSFYRLYRALAEDIEKRGGQMLYQPVTRLAAAEGGKVSVRTEQDEKIYDKVLFTASPNELRGLCDFPDEYARKLDKIKYKSNICMTIIVKQPVSEYYWVTVAEEKAPFVLFIEHTNLIKDKDYGDNHVIYLSRYIDESDPFFQAADSEIQSVFLAYAQKLFPRFHPEDILDSYIHRCVYSQPVIVRRYSEIVPPYETPVQNLYLASMSQIYPEDRGQNYAVRMGAAAAEIIKG
ncbi:MAG: NAD(P)/FAD-dependent oxidoreductase [Clostridiales bacterium]|jgi:protoporphyrinogen oxidase|nr:NAD(P)/FAD-dependent oxidoreductase [Clostridiales bacterium]